MKNKDEFQTHDIVAGIDESAGERVRLYVDGKEFLEFVPIPGGVQIYASGLGIHQLAVEPVCSNTVKVRLVTHYLKEKKRCAKKRSSGDAPAARVTSRSTGRR